MSADWPRPIRSRIRGDAGMDLGEELRGRRLVVRSCEVDCATGNRFEGRWRGIRLEELLAAADPDGTHLLAEADDGFRACIPVRNALEGILAVERLDHDSDALPRVIAPDLAGTRMVKRVVRLETKRLPPGADPADLERLDLGGENP